MFFLFLFLARGIENKGKAVITARTRGPANHRSFSDEPKSEMKNLRKMPPPPVLAGSFFSFPCSFFLSCWRAAATRLYPIFSFFYCRCCCRSFVSVAVCSAVTRFLRLATWVFLFLFCVRFVLYIFCWWEKAARAGQVAGFPGGVQRCCSREGQHWVHVLKLAGAQMSVKD